VDHVLRTTASPTQANDWALVLTAASIQHRLDEHDGHFALVIHAEDAAPAAEALDAFDAEGARVGLVQGRHRVSRRDHARRVVARGHRPDVA
jgi:hypothetical protein